MTQAEIILRVRALANEIGTSSGFWSDANALYKFLDTIQKDVIDMLYAKQVELRKIDEFFEYFALNEVKGQVLFNLSLGSSDYSFSSMSISDFRYPYDLQLGYASASNRYGTTLSNQAEQEWKAKNNYEAPTILDPLYYIALNNQGISISPVPTVNVTNGGKLTYYRTPAEVTSSQALELGDDTHKCLIYGTVYLALLQDGQKDKADRYYKLYHECLNKIK